MKVLGCVLFVVCTAMPSCGPKRHMRVQGDGSVFGGDPSFVFCPEDGAIQKEGVPDKKCP